jgi:hypothetical protein
MHHKIVNIVVSLLLIPISICTSNTLGSRSGSFSAFSIAPIASMEKIGTGSWITGGTGSVTGFSTAPFSNPALLHMPSITASAEISYRMESALTTYIKYDDMIEPSFICIGIPVDEYNISISYFRQYSHKISYPIPETTPTQPEGTGRYLIFEDRASSNIFALTSQRYFGDISLGTTIGLNYFHKSENLFDQTYTLNGYGVTFIGGIYSPLTYNLTAGAVVKYSSPVSLEVDQPSGFEAASSSDARFPPTFEGGFRWQCHPMIAFMGSYEFQNWHYVNDDYRNISIVHIGSEVSITDSISIGIGFFNQNDAQYSELDQLFITAGCKFRTKHDVFTLGILDSRMFNNSTFKSMYGPEETQFHQLMLILGISYIF